MVRSPRRCTLLPELADCTSSSFYPVSGTLCGGPTGEAFHRHPRWTEEYILLLQVTKSIFSPDTLGPVHALPGRNEGHDSSLVQQDVVG